MISAFKALFFPALEWQSRAIVSRHLRVLLRNWLTAALPPVCEPLIMLTAFGVGLGLQISQLTWAGAPIDYLSYLGPGLLAYTAFMISFFQSLWSAYMRMHFQKSWEGQLTTQVRLPHVIWGELLWSAALSTAYAVIVCLVLGGFQLAGQLQFHWAGLPLALPLVFLASLAFSCVGLLFTATLPSIDHMSLPYFLLILPLGFTSSTYFPLPDNVWLQSFALVNPLHHLCEGLRWLLLRGEFTAHFAMAAGISLLMVLTLVPCIVWLLRKRVFGDA